MQYTGGAADAREEIWHASEPAPIRRVDLRCEPHGRAVDVQLARVKDHVSAHLRDPARTRFEPR